VPIVKPENTIQSTVVTTTSIVSFSTNPPHTPQALRKSYAARVKRGLGRC
jgi:hypothetical protein